MSSTLSPSPSTSLPQTQTQTKSLLRTHLKTHVLASLPEESLAAQSLRAQEVILTQLPAWQQAQRISIYLSMPTGEARTEGLVRAALGEGKGVFVPVLCRSHDEGGGGMGSGKRAEEEGGGSGGGGGGLLPGGGGGAGRGGGGSNHEDGGTSIAALELKPRKKRRRMRMEMLRLNSLEEFERLERDAWGIPSLPSPSLAGRENARGGFGPEGWHSRPGEKEEGEEGLEGKSGNRKDVEGEDTGLDLIVVPGVAFDRDMARMGHGAGFYDGYLTRLVTEGRNKKPFLVGLCLAEQVLEPGRIAMEEWDWRVDAVATGDGRLLTADGGA
ncbi:hypothetical protein KC347_g4421 [Hortaea werneckii]|nr:hypothetical protein KC347_g4421 [Hortaea werneckii]